MESINHFTRLTAAFLGLTILVLGIAAIWLIRMRKKSLKTKKAETEERGLFSQTDELVPIDEIGPGVIVTNGGKKFVVVLKCGGSDFYTKPIGEKVRVKNNYAAFISEFTSRVTYRIYGEDINMDGTVREYERILTELQDMLFETNEDYKALRKEFETVRSDFDSIETRERSKQLLLLQKKIKAYSWRIRHVESQLAYIAKVSGPDAARQNLIQTYVVSWSAPPDLAAILTKEELYQEAAKHLKEDIKKLLHNLAECDVKAVPCSKAELFNMLHTHYHPISGNRFHFDDLLESNWDSRIMFENALYRVARKRHTAPWLILQSVKDFAKYQDTEEILKSTETFMLFRHNYLDGQYIKDTTNLNQSQVDTVLNLGGTSEAKKYGELCLVDIPTKRAVFIQADYLKDSEFDVVETDVEKIAEHARMKQGA